MPEEEIKSEEEVAEDAEFDSAWDSLDADEESEETEVTDESTQDDEEEIVKPTVETSEDATTQEVQELRAALEAERQKTASWNGRIKKANDRVAELEQMIIKMQQSSTSATSAKKPDNGAGQDILEDPELTEFKEDYPSIFAAMMKLIGKQSQETERIVNTSIGKIKPTLDNLKEDSKLSARERHFAAIDKAHPDWENLLDQGHIKNWLGALPTVARREYQRILDKGTTEEVITLFTDYKELTKTTARREGKADRLQGMMSVERETSTPRKKRTIDKEDYDGAWEEAVAES